MPHLGRTTRVSAIRSTFILRKLDQYARLSSTWRLATTVCSRSEFLACQGGVRGVSTSKATPVKQSTENGASVRVLASSQTQMLRHQIRVAHFLCRTLIIISSGTDMHRTLICGSLNCFIPNTKPKLALVSLQSYRLDTGQRGKKRKPCNIWTNPNMSKPSGPAGA